MGCEHSLCHAELNLFVTHLLFCGLGSGVATSTFRSFYSCLSREAFHYCVIELLLFHCLREHGTLLAMTRMLYSPPPRKVSQIITWWGRACGVG